MRHSDSQLGTHLIDQALDSHSGGLSRGIGVEVLPTSSASLQSCHIVQIFHCDTATFERPGVGDVCSVQSGRHRDGDRIHPGNGRGQVDESVVGRVDRRGGEGLLLIFVDSVYLGETDGGRDLGEVRSGGNLPSASVLEKLNP